jgi:hypothetical protein
MSRGLRFAVVGAALALAACSTTPTARPVVEKIVTVEKPIPVACVDKSKVPVEPKHVAGDLNGQAVHDLDVIAASAIELRGWGETLAALIGPCTKP